MSGSNPLDLTLIPDQREMRFPLQRSARVFAAVETISRDDEKETRSVTGPN